MRTVKNPNVKECCRCLYRLGFALREIEPRTNQSNHNICRWVKGIDRERKNTAHRIFEASVNFKITSHRRGEINAWNRIERTWLDLSFCTECGGPHRKVTSAHVTCSEQCSEQYAKFVRGLRRALAFTVIAEAYQSSLRTFRCAECSSSNTPEFFNRNVVYCSDRCERRAFWKRAKVKGTAARLIAVKRANPKSKLAKHLRRRLWDLVRRGKATKLTSAINLIGCTVEHFRSHIESKFLQGMTWENYGKHWHVDHVKACALFDLSKIEEQKKCFHWTNLQPLTCEANWKKGARLIAA